MLRLRLCDMAEKIPVYNYPSSSPVLMQRGVGSFYNEVNFCSFPNPKERGRSLIIWQREVERNHTFPFHSVKICTIPCACSCHAYAIILGRKGLLHFQFMQWNCIYQEASCPSKYSSSMEFGSTKRESGLCIFPILLCKIALENVSTIVRTTNVSAVCGHRMA